MPLQVFQKLLLFRSQHKGQHSNRQLTSFTVRKGLVLADRRSVSDLGFDRFFCFVCSISLLRQLMCAGEIEGYISLDFLKFRNVKSGDSQLKIRRVCKKISIKIVKNFQEISAKSSKKLVEKSGQGFTCAPRRARV